MAEPSNNPAPRLSPAKLELLRKLQAKAAPRRLADQPIAVIGVAARVPGASSYTELWRLVAEGRDAITEVPGSRFGIDAYYHPDPQRPGMISSRFGGFVSGIEQFDAELFSISPREAATLDPQHRLLLETSWLAFEDAGLRRDQLRGRPAGVFVATYQRDYAQLAVQDRFAIDAYTASGTHHSIVAGRLAYLFDLHGPALVVDTACSSSLVALHLGCRSLLSGETDLALVGASNLMLTPEESVALSRWGMLAPDGRCKSFDGEADGFVRGEGVVALVLARLDDAVAAGHRVRALVRGTAVNQDGHSNGLTAPNQDAQAAVLRAALADAGIEPGAVGYIEAHGTGTSLGDPIEVAAIRSVYGEASELAPVCKIGSLKSNIGHLEACAGLAGVAKAIACLEQREIPATLHFRRLNPKIELDGSRLAIASEHSPWPSPSPSGAPRCVGVSSFGMGGTNAHAILSEAPVKPPDRAQDTSRRVWLLPLSAHARPSLLALLDAHREALRTEVDLDSWCASAATTRTHHSQHRIAVVGASADELARELDARAVALADSPRTQPKPKPKPKPGVVFACPGQGGQWLGMGRELLDRGGPFTEALEACDAAIQSIAGWSVIAALRDPGFSPDSLGRIDRIQPLLFALSLGYAAMWRGLGLVPDACIGHSMGEVAAAQLCGHLSLADAARVIVRRSALMAELAGSGTMVAVDLPATELEAALVGLDPRLAVAADNGPSASVVSGPGAAIETLVAQLEARAVRTRRIAVDVASHGPLVEVLDGRLRDALAELGAPVSSASGSASGSGTDGRPALYSTVEARRLDPRAHLDADYWRRNLRERVQLWPALEAALADGHGIFIELGPHPVLLPSLRDGLDARRVPGVLVASARRDADADLEPCRGLAALYEAGVDLDWDAIHAGAPLLPDPAGGPDLPPYPFTRTAHWLPRVEARVARAPRVHPFIGPATALAKTRGQAWLWTGSVELERAPFLADHHVEGSVVLPGMGSVDLVLSALAEAGAAASELRDSSFERPIVVHADEPVELQLRVEDGAFELWAQTGTGAEREWTRRVHGRVVPRETPGPALALESLRGRATPLRERADFYAGLNASGNLWGPAFQGVRAIARLEPHAAGDPAGDPAGPAGPRELLVDLDIPPSLTDELGHHWFHPALLDASAQALLVEDDALGSLVLAQIDRVAIYGPADQTHASVIRLDPDPPPGSVRGDVVVCARDGARLVEIEGLRVQFIHARPKTWFHALEWRVAAPVPRPPRHPSRPGPGVRGPVAIVGGAVELRAAILAALGERGREAFAVTDTSELAASAHTELLVLATPVDSTPLEATVSCCAAILAAAAASPARMWLVTQAGAPTLAAPSHPHGPHGPDPVQAAAWGLGRALEAERGSNFGASLDLDPALDLRRDAPELAGWIAAELELEDAATVVALRDRERLAACLEPRPLPAQDPLSSSPSPLADLGPDRAYLITGGLGGLGLAFAAHLIERGARHLILVGRRALPPRQAWRGATDDSTDALTIDAVLALEALGATVTTAAFDIADPGALAQFVATWTAQRRPAIAGVIHAAGVQHPRALAELTPARLDEDLRAKVGGAAAIDAVFFDDRLDVGLDFVIAFSSAAALLPSPRLGAYMAANAYLDAWATAARRDGRVVTAVGWGLLAEGGMAKRHFAAGGRVLGFESMEPGAAFACLDPMLARGLGHLAVMAVDWPGWFEHHPELARSPYFAALAPTSHADDATLATPTTHDPRGRLDPALDADSELERRARLDRYLRQQLARVLRLDPKAGAAAIDADAPLTHLGIDSLMALELRNRVEAETGAAPAVVELLRGISLTRLVDLVAAELDAHASETPDVTPKVAPDLSTDDWEELTI